MLKRATNAPSDVCSCCCRILGNTDRADGRGCESGWTSTWRPWAHQTRRPAIRKPPSPQASLPPQRRPADTRAALRLRHQVVAIMTAIAFPYERRFDGACPAVSQKHPNPPAQHHANKVRALSHSRRGGGDRYLWPMKCRIWACGLPPLIPTWHWPSSFCAASLCADFADASALAQALACTSRRAGCPRARLGVSPRWFALVGGAWRGRRPRPMGWITVK